jgi:hypothetical protein
MSLQAFSDVLFQERRLLELLLFKLEEEHLVLQSGKTRWLNHASGEVETVLDELNKIELTRSVAFAGVAPELGLGPDATLGSLVAAAPVPWGAVFAEHHVELRTLMGEVLETAESSRDMLRDGYDTIRQALEATG